MENNIRSGPFWDMIEGRKPLPAVSRLLGLKILALDAAKGTIKVENELHASGHGRSAIRGGQGGSPRAGHYVP